MNCDVSNYLKKPFCLFLSICLLEFWYCILNCLSFFKYKCNNKTYLYCLSLTWAIFFFLGSFCLIDLGREWVVLPNFFTEYQVSCHSKFALVSTWRYDRGGDTILLSFLHFFLFFLFIFHIYLIFFLCIVFPMIF